MLPNSLLVVILLTTLCASTPLAQIHISGPQTGVLLDTTYIVDAAISVPAGSSLIIQPGAVLYFDGGTFTINGYLYAVGTLSDSIVFTRRPGSNFWYGISFTDSAADSSIMEYCLIYGGYGSGGIKCNLVSPTFRHCTVRRNYSILHGGGFQLTYSHAVIDQCLIEHNSCWDHGAGICCNWSSPVISNCMIRENYPRTTYSSHGATGGGIWLRYSGGALIENCLIIGNVSDSRGSAITCIQATYAVISNCTIVGNITYGPSNQEIKGGIYSEDPATTLTNCIIWGNQPHQLIGNLQVAYCDVERGWPGVGNVNIDPLFVPGPDGSYYLSQVAAGQPVNSPCVDAGNPTWPMITGTTRTDGVQDSGVVDMGYHYPVAGDWSLAAGEEFPPLFPAGVRPLAEREDRGDLFGGGGDLLMAHPNPFNLVTTIRYALQAASHVRLSIWDTAGRLVATLVNGWREAGNHEAAFDGSNLPSGIYFYSLQTGEQSANGKMILLK